MRFPLEIPTLVSPDNTPEKAIPINPYGQGWLKGVPVIPDWDIFGNQEGGAMAKWVCRSLEDSWLEKKKSGMSWDAPTERDRDLGYSWIDHPRWIQDLE